MLRIQAMSRFRNLRVRILDLLSFIENRDIEFARLEFITIDSENCIARNYDVSIRNLAALSTNVESDF